MTQHAAKILVVDDQPLLAATLSAILKDAGYQTSTALSGEEAISIAQDFAPDFLLTDVSMPGINGIETAIRVQAMLATCRVMLISGHASTRDLLRDAIATGHNFEILAKPIHPTELLEKIEQILTVDPRPIATVLNVDDNEIHRYAVTQLLSHQGFAVQEASSGEQALELALTKPDIVLLDISLPGIDGFEVCRRLKMMPETAGIPVIHLTNAYKNEQARAMSVMSGATEYMVHPVDTNALFQLLDKLVACGKNVPKAAM